jgi:hypothetical protein
LAAIRPVVTQGALISGPKRTKPERSSPAAGVSVGPSALDRRTGTVRSAVRSRGIARSLHGAPRRHHCRPAARYDRLQRLSAASAGRPPSLWVAGRRLWPVREAPKHSDRNRRTPPGGILSGVSAPRPRAAAFWHASEPDRARRRVCAERGTWSGCRETSWSQGSPCGPDDPEPPTVWVDSACGLSLCGLSPIFACFRAHWCCMLRAGVEVWDARRGAVRCTSWRQAKVSGALSDSGGVEKPASVSRHSLASSAVAAMLILPLCLHRGTRTGKPADSWAL